MKMRKAISYSVLVIVLITGAYFLACRVLPNSPRESIKLDTIVYHVCENEEVGNATIHTPNATDVYQQIIEANNGTYPNILLFPTYAGTWEDELAWLTSSFGGPNGVPIMLEVLCGGNTTLFQLSTEQILSVMQVCNVKWLRFAEVTSFCIENELPFPAEYVSKILKFCKDHNLKLFWTEWKDDYLPAVETFTAIKKYISGFEDIVTVSFSTNSGEMEPDQGFAYVKNLFPHWGGSIQSWHWETRQRQGEDPIDKEESRNMPINRMVEHTLLCRDMGAEIIQFEPYWYFFGDTDGKARESCRSYTKT